MKYKFLSTRLLYYIACYVKELQGMLCALLRGYQIASVKLAALLKANNERATVSILYYLYSPPYLMKKKAEVIV